MIAITRYRVPEGSPAEQFQAELAPVLTALEASPGFRYGRIGRCVDDPELWALVTEWDGAGYYRRALGAYEVRMAFIPLSALAVDEPGAYEVVKPG
ncbi:antibiotic biosynthesis monooxygenase family protein [Actinocorallia populi]|uniref:antibiotic biosynthesis monooxygenase family protein n=1 Tax=Actinocorallia populi TaxID=2079200 RepID=UPI000D0869FF|nr:antibiotic biosynthesis monooxygenase [Actinocorallia populi]